METAIKPLEIQRSPTWKDRLLIMQVGEKQTYAFKHFSSIRPTKCLVEKETSMRFITESEAGSISIIRKV